jgi:hypothetical protein
MPKPLSTPLTNTLEALADGLEAAGIDPRAVEVSLPLTDWQHLARTLDDEGTNTTGDIGRIELGGARYLVSFGAPRETASCALAGSPSPASGRTTGRCECCSSPPRLSAALRGRLQPLNSA